MDTTRFLNKNQSITIPKYLYDSLRTDIIADKRLENLFKELLFEKIRLSEDEFIYSMLSSSYATTRDNNLHMDYLTKVRSIFKQFAISGYINYSFILEAYYFSIK